MKILIADDDATSIALLTSVLQKSGHEVIVTEDGIYAWETLRDSNTLRMAILDWMMPGLEGPEICRRLRALDLTHPPYLILLTMRGEKKDVAEGLLAGADDYLSKPFDPVELNARIEVGCRMISLQDRLAAKVQELQDALIHIKTLRGCLPICAWCKKIRDDKGFWEQVDIYVSRHSDARFTHGLCPECSRKLKESDWNA